MDITPNKVIAAAIGFYVAIKAGLPLSRERTQAMLPYVSDCPSFAYNFLIGNFETEIITYTINCMTGVLIFLAIPGSIGLFLMFYRNG